MNEDTQTLLLLAGGVAVLWFLSQQNAALATGPTPGIPVYSTTAAPVSIYPEFAYTAQTSMAATPAQKTTAVQPTSLFTATQQQAAWALQTQCAGSYPGCTPLLGDTQLGL
jgi:hypothetical protein